MVKDPFATRKAIEARLRGGPLSGFEFIRIHSNLNRMIGPLRRKSGLGTLTGRERTDLHHLEDTLSQAKALYKPARGPRGGLSMAELEMKQLEQRKMARSKRPRVAVRRHRRRQ